MEAEDDEDVYTPSSTYSGNVFILRITGMRSHCTWEPRDDKFKGTSKSWGLIIDDDEEEEDTVNWGEEVRKFDEVFDGVDKTVVSTTEENLSNDVDFRRLYIRDGVVALLPVRR